MDLTNTCRLVICALTLPSVLKEKLILVPFSFVNNIFFLKLFNQENEFLHELFEIVTPKREDVSGYGCQLYELDSKEVSLSENMQ